MLKQQLVLSAVLWSSTLWSSAEARGAQLSAHSSAASCRDGLLFSSELDEVALCGPHSTQPSALTAQHSALRAQHSALSAEELELRGKQASLSRYQNKWLLHKDSLEVSAVMVMDWEIAEGEYVTGFKSIADGAPAKKVEESTVSVVERSGDSEFELRHKVYEDDGYTFVKFWFNEPLEANDKATIEIRYKIRGGVCSRADPNSATGGRVEEFSGLWANFWKIPVAGITYEFNLPAPDTNWKSLSPRLTQPEGVESNAPVLAEWDGVGDADERAAVLKQSNSFTSSQLRIGMDPRDVVYQWGREDGSSSADACDGDGSGSGGGVDGTLIGIIVGSVVGGLCLIAGCWVIIGQNCSQEHSAPHVTTAAPLPQASGGTYQPPIAIPLSWEQQQHGTAPTAIPVQIPNAVPPSPDQGQATGAFVGGKVPSAPPLPPS